MLTQQECLLVQNILSGQSLGEVCEGTVMTPSKVRTVLQRVVQKLASDDASPAVNLSVD